MPAVEVALLFQSRVEEKLLSENVNPPAEVEGRHVHDRLTLSEKEERWCMLDVELLPKMEKNRRIRCGPKNPARQRDRNRRAGSPSI